MNVNELKEIKLFANFSNLEIKEAINSLKIINKTYLKGEVIFHQGDIINTIGIVLEGSVNIENIDIWGNENILSHIEKYQIFAETYALLKKEPLMVEAVSNETSNILLLNIESINYLNNISDSWKIKLLSNLLEISIQKNLNLSIRSFHTSSKSIRSRVMAYLNTMAIKTNKKEFNIPFNREQLANYLNVERTALSKELSKMQKDNIIKVKKNHFIIVDIDL